MIKITLRVVLIGISIFFYQYLNGQEKKVTKKSELLLHAIDKCHYQPRSIDDSFSAFLYDDFIQSLDERKLIFSTSDLEQINKYKYELDNYMNNKDYSFINEISTLYNKRLNETVSFLNSQKDIDYNFELNDSICFYKNRGYLNSKDLVVRYQKLIKYAALRLYFQQSDTIREDVAVEPDRLKQFKDEAIEGELCWIQNRLTQGNSIEQYIEDSFLKSLSNTFDPHTLYLSPSENDFFNNSLSKESLSFGIELYRNNRGELEIESLIPGGPAWKSNKINEGDIIKSLQGENDSKLDLKCIPTKEAVEIIYSDKVKKVVFSIQKKNGKQVEVELQKELIDVEENAIQSFVLDGEKKIGYIYLPSFYTNSDDWFYPQGCANDVAKAIFNLKREGIEGLIFDIRNNGGGSMYEAINMAGIFINYGAISISDSKEDGLETIKDMNRGMAFTKPMVVLQNQYSASASELFAAAMQDYNRAVIVGAHSYGKSTIQQIVPLCNDLDTLSDNIGKDGYLKVTIGKFYRIDGTTHQKIGVQPDIRLANIFDKDSIGEVNASNALCNDTISKKVYAYPSPVIPIGTLRLKSRDRIKENNHFKSFVENDSHKSNEITYVVPLNAKNYACYFNEKKSKSKEDQDNTSVYNVLCSAYLKSYGLESDQSISKQQAQIAQDKYITESFQIVNDLINLK
ncbi:hypothetical protein E9993_18245 [Labilibacter sediminis]|nr:hypothetical protein E9993_18245 [Labilibacter sediminis]